MNSDIDINRSQCWLYHVSEAIISQNLSIFGYGEIIPEILK